MTRKGIWNRVITERGMAIKITEMDEMVRIWNRVIREMDDTDEDLKEGD